MTWTNVFYDMARMHMASVVSIALKMGGFIKRIFVKYLGAYRKINMVKTILETRQKKCLRSFACFVRPRTCANGFGGLHSRSLWVTAILTLRTTPYTTQMARMRDLALCTMSYARYVMNVSTTWLFQWPATIALQRLIPTY